MRILITNDDGIYSPGILALAEVARQFGEVRIVAPEIEMSSASHSITALRPLSYKPTRIDEFEAYRVNGTPADCVALGIHNWDQQVDLVLSGINLGSNLGNSIWHSGTLAGAKQAALFGVRGVAFSMPTADMPDFSPVKPWVETILKLLLGMPPLPLINVNLPAAIPHGLQWTRQSVRQYDGKVVMAKDPMGRDLFWFTVLPLQNPEEGTDRHAVDHGYVSLTPLRLDLTDEARLPDLSVTHPLSVSSFK